MQKICLTRLGTDHSCNLKVWFLRSTLDTFCDRQKTRLTDNGEVIPICHHYFAAGDTKKSHSFLYKIHARIWSGVSNYCKTNPKARNVAIGQRCPPHFSTFVKKFSDGHA